MLLLHKFKKNEDKTKTYTDAVFFFFLLFFMQKRSHLVKQLNDSGPSTSSPLMEGTPTIKSRKKLLQIIDTTLLKCYLHVRPKKLICTHLALTNDW